MPQEELYELETDPHEITNLSNSPKHQDVIERLRGVLEKWIEETNDQGRTLEPADLAARKGMTKTKTNRQSGYTLDEKSLEPTQLTWPQKK